ncbi:hydrolase [Enterococcus faecium]|nr:hydrolase [Enterococcus faecium]EGP5249191.1 hydrolase [Enterococcus faecium]EGP5392878.1 hydrolase [Enterococcus faecium]
MNGVQKLASAVISPTKRKIGGAIFVWLFLLLDAEQLFHNLSTKRCSLANSSVTNHNIQQTREIVF